MRKFIFTVFLAVACTLVTYAQESNYGLTAGYHNLIAKGSYQGVTASNGESGFFIGAFADFTIAEKLHLQPELQYAVAFANGESGSELIIPVMAKYYVADKFNLQAGPQLDIILEESPGIKALGFGLGFGAGYDINDKLFVVTRYSLGLNNRLDNIQTFDFEGLPIELNDIKSKLNFFQVGIGYRF